MVKDCPSGKIRNPASGRCVDINGKIGKKLKSRVSPKKVSPKKVGKCKDDQILNPLTGRCVKKSGKIGKTLLKGKIKVPTPKVPTPKVPTPKVSPKFKSITLFLEENEKFWSKLSDEELEAIADYSDNSFGFEDGEYFPILEKTLENAPKLSSSIVVYRQLDIETRKDFREKTDGLISTTLDLTFAKERSKKVNSPCCIVKILLQKGTRCLYIGEHSAYGQEYELLLPLGTLKLVGYGDKNTIHTVYVPKDEKSDIAKNEVTKLIRDIELRDK